MRRLAIVFNMLLVLSVVLAAAAPLALAEESGPALNPPDPWRAGAVIDWTPPALVIRLAPGETELANASFVSHQAIDNATLVVSSSLSRFVQVEPSTPFSIVAGAVNNVQLTARWPAEITGRMPAIVTGMVQVVSQRRTYQLPLFVSLVRVDPRPPIQWTPPQVRLWVDPADADDAATATAPVSTTTVLFTTAVTITNAQIRATAPVNQALDLSLTGPMTITPGVTYTLVLTAHQPVLTAADLDDADTGVGRRIVSGVIEVYDGQRVYPRNLPVSVVLARRPVQPVIAWRPPLLTLRLAPSEVATRVVTMTSSMTIANALLSVTGPITPYLTVSTSEPAPFTLLPHHAYPVTVTVTSPATPIINRPLMGGVAVTDSSGHVYRFDLKVYLFWHRPTPRP